MCSSGFMSLVLRSGLTLAPGCSFRGTPIASFKASRARARRDSTVPGAIFSASAICAVGMLSK